MQDVNQLRQSREYVRRLEAALDSTNDSVIIFAASSADLRIEYVNAAFCRMFGFDRCDVIGKSLGVLSAFRNDRSAMDELRAALSGHGIYCRELAYSGSAGPFVAEWRITHILQDTDSGDPCVAVVRDLTEKHAYERALRESDQLAQRQIAELETLYDAAPIGLAMFSKDLRFLRVNDTLARINGIPAEQHIDRTPRQIVPTLAEQVEPFLRKVLETGEPVLGVEVEGETPKSPGLRRSWREHFYPVLFDHSIEGVGAVVEEITEQKRAERHLRLVMQELNHRVKNSLAVVQSIASQTVRSSTSLADFEEALIGRIRALANTHTLLTESNWRSARLIELLRETVRPYRPGGLGTVEISGPEVMLTPSSSLAFSMVFHELTTNASKYGALSSPGGTIAVHWRRIEERGRASLLLSWAETGGPPVQGPNRPGFGGQLIEFTIGHEFGGTSKIDYTDKGVVCTMTIPWERVALQPSSPAEG